MVDIYDWNDLDAVRNDLAGDYVLQNDLDSSTTGYSGTGDAFEPIGFISGDDFTSEFTGSFNGDGNAILDLVVDKPSVSSGDIGLFASTGSGALIENTLVSGQVSASAGPTGGVIGIHNGGTIRDCASFVDVDVGGDRAGGFAGSVNSSLKDCYAGGVVDGNDRVGGFAGQNAGTVERSYATGNVTGGGDVGGFIGASFGTENDCYWDIESTTQTVSSGTGTGLTTSEMQGDQASTNMSGFDFSAVWDEVIAGTSPTVNNQVPASDAYPILSALDAINQLDSQGISTESAFDGIYIDGSEYDCLVDGTQYDVIQN